MARPFSKGFGQLSTKHVAVDQMNTKVIVAIASATAILVFGIFATIALINKISYQNLVISERDKANKQLEENITATSQLQASFLAFDTASESIIGTADNNSKIVLDALPSKYDFPALATSLEAIIKGAGLTVGSITGTDEEATAAQSKINPTPIAIPFSISAEGSYEAVQKLVKDLERSIRPFKISSIQITGEDSNLTVTIDGETYYQPSKELGIEEKVVKSGQSQTTPATQGAAQ